MRLIVFIFSCLFASMLSAQTYPAYTSTTVNDFADLISPDAEVWLDTELEQLRRDTGIEMTVVTLKRKSEFSPDASLEDFAAGLFNAWGIGDAKTNDGILILVLHEDRQIRIELGKAYGHDWDRATAAVIDRSFLPDFRLDQYQSGIESGVADSINSIAIPYHNGEKFSDQGFSAWWLALAVVPFLLLGFWRRLKTYFQSWQKCPQCGQRHLSVVDEVLNKATRKAKGTGQKRIDCSNCGYHSITGYSISQISSSSSSSSGFGGGSSGGGGASGSW